MGLLDRVKESTGGVMDIAGGAGAMAMDKVTELLEEYKKALAVLAKFGFTVGKFDVDIGILPKVRTSVRGSLDGIDESAMKQLIVDRKDESLTVAMLKALVTAKELSERIELSKRSIALDVTLGIPPSISAQIGE